MKNTSDNSILKDRGTKPVVLATLDRWEFEEFLTPWLDSRPWPFAIERMESDYTNDDLVEALNRRPSEVLLTCWKTKPLPKEVLRTSSLKYVAHVGGAVGFFVPRELLRQGLVVSNWGDVVAHTVAEHSLLQVLACLRKATKWQLDMHIRGQWKSQEYEVLSLFGRRVGIYGFGVCARAFVKLIQPFGCQVSTFSESLPEVMDADIKRAGSLEELFAANEIIVVLEALTEKTARSLDERLLRMLPEGSVFANTARGGIIDEAALGRVAQEKKIQIALDVFEEEPLPESSPLRGCENVFLTPHIAGPTTDARKACGLHALQNIEAYLDKRPVQSLVGLEQYDRMSCS